MAKKYNDKVEVISAPFDTNKYVSDNHDHGERVVLGWLGTPMTSYLLNLIKEPMTEVAKEVSNLEFHNIAGLPVDFPGMKVVNIPWSEEREVEYLSEFDIGLMPLDDTEFNKGRLGGKMVIYASMGLPIVADDVGLNREVVTDGVNGYLVKTPTEWKERLLTLIKDPDLRRRMGSKGREVATARFDLQICAAKYKGILERLIQSKK